MTILYPWGPCCPTVFLLLPSEALYESPWAVLLHYSVQHVFFPFPCWPLCSIEPFKSSAVLIVSSTICSFRLPLLSHVSGLPLPTWIPPSLIQPNRLVWIRTFLLSSLLSRPGSHCLNFSDPCLHLNAQYASPSHFQQRLFLFPCFLLLGMHNDLLVFPLTLQAPC